MREPGFRGGIVTIQAVMRPIPTEAPLTSLAALVLNTEVSNRRV
jgi:hypothetical protein